MNKPAKKAVYLIVIAVGFVFSMLNMIYWADSVAKHTNYFVSLGVLPMLVGILLGCIGSVILEKSIFKNWRIKATGALAPLIPQLYVICVMTFTSH